ncbi:hypothetical protein TIFTF001_035037 [Ficus carica]|uniref:Uncharacterized protein n=1 Tax=Ficus carica TaxID=3494 RepID=A0AA88E1K8_FICCA|nr:hypothetical protein TIFTF001_035037 [Ficus carica]
MIFLASSLSISPSSSSFFNCLFFGHDLVDNSPSLRCDSYPPGGGIDILKCGRAVKHVLPPAYLFPLRPCHHVTIFFSFMELLHRARVALQLCATLDLCKAREVVDCILLRTISETCLSFKEARELSDADILQMHSVLRVDIVDVDVGKCFFVIFMVAL